MDLMLADSSCLPLPPLGAVTPSRVISLLARLRRSAGREFFRKEGKPREGRQLSSFSTAEVKTSSSILSSISPCTSSLTFSALAPGCLLASLSSEARKFRHLSRSWGSVGSVGTVEADPPIPSGTALGECWMGRGLSSVSVPAGSFLFLASLKFSESSSRFVLFLFNPKQMTAITC